MKRRPLRRAVLDRSQAGRSPDRLRTRLLRLESLESRTLLSGAPPGYVAGPEFRVNAITAGNQSFEQFNAQNVAMDPDGDAVVVWVSDSQDGSLTGVRGQRFASDGTAAGVEFPVNLYTQDQQINASVAMDADGDFVVTWSSLEQDGSYWGVYARRFNAAGTPRGGEFRVNETTRDYQRLSSVAMDAHGNFMIVWGQRPLPDQPGISRVMGRKYDAEGAPLGPEFQINAETTDFLTQPHVAINARGDATVVWLRRQAAGTDDVYARTFAPDGTPRGDEFRVHRHSENQQIRPSVAIDGSGEFVVAWYNQITNDDAGGIEPRNVYLRRFSPNGTPLSDDVLVNSSPQPQHRNPVLAMRPEGDFVVSWDARFREPAANGTYGIFMQAYDADGERIAGEMLVNDTMSGDQEFPSGAMDSNGNLFIAWMSDAQPGQGEEIYARRYQLDTDRAAPAVANVFAAGDDHGISEAEVLVQRPDRLVVSFSEAIDAPVGNARSQWRLRRNGVDASQELVVATYVFNGAANRYEAILDFEGALPEGDYELTALPSIRDLHGHLLDGDYDGQEGGAFIRRFTIAAPVESGDEWIVNHRWKDGDQTFGLAGPGTLARDALGNTTIVWTGPSTIPSHGTDIFARRFKADGVPLGDEFVVNDVTLGDQSEPAVASSADGNFAIVWTSIREISANDADMEDIYIRHFTPDGVATGLQTRVNTGGTNAQRRPTIAMNSGGAMVVAWESTSQLPGGAGVDIRFQRYFANGALDGLERFGNVETAGTQRFPHVAMDDYSDFVLTWTLLQAGGVQHVYARRFSAAEGPLVGNEFPVMSPAEGTVGDQRNPAVAMDASGHFIVVWQAKLSDVDQEDIYARRFESRSREEPTQVFPAGPPQRVIKNAPGVQQRPAVAMDHDGDFVVAWQSNVPGVPGEPGVTRGNDIVLRRFAWNGTAQSDEIPIADEGATNQQTLPNIAMDEQGDFVVAWTSQELDASGAGIFAQRFEGFVNSPPVAEAGGPYVINEGQALQLNASGSADVDPGHVAQLRYDWDLDGDGVFDDLVAVGATATAPWSTLTALGIVDDGQYPISVRVTDPLGGVSVDSATLTLSNTAPGQLVLTAGAPIDEGNQASVSGSFFDPGVSDEHQLLIDWGDGTIEALSIPAGTQAFSFTHVYIDDNFADSFRITARVIDDDEGMSEQAETFQAVANLAPFSLAVQLSNAKEGETFTVVGSFLDAGAGDVHDVYVNWGEGGGLEKLPASAVVSGQFTATHVYRNNRASVPIRFLVSDDDGGSVQSTLSVNVANASPANVSLTLAASIVAVDGLVQLSGTFTDTGLDDPHIVDVFWGDGSLQSIPLTIGDRSFVATYRYPLSRIYVISVTVSDEMDALASGTTTVQIICGVPGDTNADCKVNVADMNAVRNNFGSVGALGIPGDTYPFDGAVDIKDLNQVRNQFGATAPAPLLGQASLETRRVDERSALLTRQALDVVFARWSNPEAPDLRWSAASTHAPGYLRRKATIGSR